MAHFRVFIKAVNVMEKVEGEEKNIYNIPNDRAYMSFTNDIVEVINNIVAENEEEVKEKLKVDYPHIFNEKVYNRSSKSEKQFFYARIYELSESQVDCINSGEWVCDSCEQKQLNKFDVPVINYNNKEFCSYECRNNFINKNIDELDSPYYDKGITYIYKITQKSTNKCYIGKTINFPFFRWWNHYQHSTSPFGMELKNSDITDWNFEILEVLENKSDHEVFTIETNYIKLYESNQEEKGFNKQIYTKTHE